MAFGAGLAFDRGEKIGFEASCVKTTIGDGEFCFGIKAMAGLTATLARHAEMGRVIEDGKILCVRIGRKGLPVNGKLTPRETIHTVAAGTFPNRVGVRKADSSASP